MLKIYSNHNKQDVTYSFTIGQTFPDVKGKLLRIEINGKELSKLIEAWEVPLEFESTDNPYLIWHGKQAGRVLKRLREMF
jgi:hypothetical protein